MGLELIPDKIHERFQIEERNHACAILAHDFPSEFADLIGCLEQFQLLRSEVIAEGGRKTKIANRFDGYLYDRQWKEKSTKIVMTIDDVAKQVETHSIDLCKGRVACEVQWNSKDGVFSRDLTTMRLLHEIGVISVGAIVTRCDELQELFDSLGYVKDKRNDWKQVGKKYGPSTTHWGKLMGRVRGGDGGHCPLLLIGIRRACYVDDMPGVRPRLTV